MTPIEDIITLGKENKRELWAGLENVICVYKILNKITGKYYVGSTIQTSRRLKRHISELRNGVHHCEYLQRSWSKYGEEAFVFQICHVFLSESEARTCEQAYLDLKREYIYNCSYGATGGNLIGAHPRREEIIRYREKRKKDIWLSLTEEQRAARIKLRSEKSKGENNGMYGRKHTEHSKQKMKENAPKDHSYLKGVKKSPEARMKMSDAAKKRVGPKNPFYGKTHSEKTKSIIREKNSKLKPPNCKGITIDGVSYPSMTAAARSLGVCTATISYRLGSKNKKYSDYRLEDSV